MAKLITFSKSNGIATVTINNPPMNVLSQQVIKELGETFSRLEQDDEVISIILTGEGDRAFMAGADIKEFPERDSQDSIRVLPVFNQIANIPKPTIAVLNGFTLGGGLELALTCDIRVAEEHAQIGLPEVTLGLLPGGGGTQRLPKLVGPSKAKEIMFSGAPLTAEAALDLGIVNHVVAQGDGMKKAVELAENYARYSLQALGRIKKLVNLTNEESLEEGLKQEEKEFEALFATEDAQEGVQAFIEKRKPIFKHK